MERAFSAALMGATPMAFVSVEALLVIGAIVAAAGAVITGVIAFRATRRRAAGRGGGPAGAVAVEPRMDDDPIVSALVGTSGGRRSQRPRKPDRTEP